MTKLCPLVVYSPENLWFHEISYDIDYGSHSILAIPNFQYFIVPA